MPVYQSVGAKATPWGKHQMMVVEVGIFLYPSFVARLKIGDGVISFSSLSGTTVKLIMLK